MDCGLFQKTLLHTGDLPLVQASGAECKDAQRDEASALALCLP